MNKLSTIKNISIGFSCSQNFDKMQPNDIGRYCMNCNKTVVDFTDYSNKQILDYFDNRSSKTCGRFSEVQLSSLNREQKKEQTSQITILKGLIFTIYLLFTSCKSTKPINKTLETSHENCELHESKYLTVQNIGEENQKITFRGIVRDYKNEPLIGVNLSIKESEIILITDIEGKFDFEVDNTVLKYTKFDKVNKVEIEKEFADSTDINVSYVGYKNLNLKYVDIKNKEIDIVLAEDIVIGEVVISKQPIHKRFWFGIKNIFR